MRRDEQRLRDILDALDSVAKMIGGRTEAEVPWTDIVGQRNILVHEYFGIYWPLVWQAATDHAPGLRNRIAEILAAEFSD